MNHKNSFLHSLLIALTISSCVPSKNSIIYPLSGELDQTRWTIHNTTDGSKTDTIEFSFGYMNSGEVLNLIAYNSDGKKELCEFRVVSDSIIFKSYSTSPPFIGIDFSNCVTENVLTYNNHQLHYKSLISICGKAKKEHLIEASILKVSKLWTAANNRLGSMVGL